MRKGSASKIEFMTEPVSAAIAEQIKYAKDPKNQGCLTCKNQNENPEITEGYDNKSRQLQLPCEYFKRYVCLKTNCDHWKPDRC